jgi:hypothetical protein
MASHQINKGKNVWQFCHTNHYESWPTANDIALTQPLMITITSDNKINQKYGFKNFE